MERRERVGWVSAAGATVLVLPAVVFVAANVLKYGLGLGFLADALGPFTEPSPGLAEVFVAGVVLLGPLAALGVALPPILRFRLRRSGGIAEATINVRLRWPFVIVAVVAIGAVGALSAYLLVENGACWFGSTPSC